MFTCFFDSSNYTLSKFPLAEMADHGLLDCIPETFGNDLINSRVTNDCKFKGKKLYGKIQFVTNYPDVKVQFVDAFPDLNIKVVNSKFANVKKGYPIVVSRALGLYNELCRHFFKQDPKTKIIIMATNKSVKQLTVDHKIITTQYDYVNSLYPNALGNYVLCECFSKKPIKTSG